MTTNKAFKSLIQKLSECSWRNDCTNSSLELDTILMKSFTNDGEDLSTILQTLEETFDTNEIKEYQFMGHFFTKYIATLPIPEIKKRIFYFIEYHCIILIQYAAAFNIFRKVDVSEFLPYAIEQGDDTIIELLENELALTKQRDVCTSGDSEEFVDVPMKRIKITLMSMSKVISPEQLDVDPKTLFSKKTYSIDVHENKYLLGIDSVIQTPIDTQWLHECNEYLLRLPMYDLYTCKAYTYGANINTYLIKYKEEKVDSPSFIQFTDGVRFPFISFKLNPLFFQIRDVISRLTPSQMKSFTNFTQQEVQHILQTKLQTSYELIDAYMSDRSKRFDPVLWKMVFEQYDDDLRRIIHNAPPLKKEMHVYRGTLSHYYSNKKGNVFKNQNYTSTSFYSSVIDKFAYVHTGGGCCVTEFILKPGAHCIWLDPVTFFENELEILLPPDQSFVIMSKKILKYLNEPNTFTSEDIKREEFEEMYRVKNGEEGVVRHIKRKELCSDEKKSRLDYTLMKQINNT